jgi:cytochrome c2
MYHQFSSMLAVLLLVIAAVTVLIMLEMNSKMENREPTDRSAFRNVLGSVFLFLFAVLLGYLIFTAGSFKENVSADSPHLLYIILSLLLVPLLVIRAVMARRKAQISTRLLLLGISLFVLSFGLTGIAAKYYALHEGGLSQLLNAADSNIVSVETGQAVLSKKCSKCHSLERVYTTSTTDWSATVTKMAGFDPNISESDIKLISEYLNQLRKTVPQRTSVERGRDLVTAKCSTCHSLDKVFSANMTPDRWAQTVDDMMKIMGLPDFISEQEKEDIVAFLAERRRQQAVTWSSGMTTSESLSDEEMDAARRLVARKCSAGCHALDRVLRSRSEKSREQWVDIINSMIEITGDPDFLTEKENKIILDYLSRPMIEEEKEQPRSSGMTHPLVSRKCGACHNLERVRKAAKSKEDWAATVRNMAAHADQNGADDFLSQKDQEDIVTIISSWEVQK